MGEDRCYPPLKPAPPLPGEMTCGEERRPPKRWQCALPYPYDQGERAVRLEWEEETQDGTVGRRGYRWRGAEVRGGRAGNQTRHLQTWTYHLTMPYPHHASPLSLTHPP